MTILKEFVNDYKKELKQITGEGDKLWKVTMCINGCLSILFMIVWIRNKFVDCHAYLILIGMFWLVDFVFLFIKSTIIKQNRTTSVGEARLSILLKLCDIKHIDWKDENVIKNLISDIEKLEKKENIFGTVIYESVTTLFVPVAAVSTVLLNKIPWESLVSTVNMDVIGMLVVLAILIVILCITFIYIKKRMCIDYNDNFNVYKIICNNLNQITYLQQGYLNSLAQTDTENVTEVNENNTELG